MYNSDTDSDSSEKSVDSLEDFVRYKPNAIEEADLKGKVVRITAESPCVKSTFTYAKALQGNLLMLEMENDLYGALDITKKDHKNVIENAIATVQPGRICVKPSL